MPRHCVQLGEVKTTYLDHGEGIPVVALHGMHTSSALYEPLLPHLKDFRMIAPDLLGQGDTQTPAVGALGHAAYADHLNQFLAAVPPRCFHLIAHDLGALLGLDWAIVRPERVASLVILSTMGTWRWQCAMNLAVRRAFNLLAGQTAVRHALRASVTNRTALPERLEIEWSRPWTRRRALRGSDHFGATHVQHVYSRLSSLRLPCLIVWGEDDTLFPVENAEAIRTALPHASILTLPRAGHLVPLDAPECLATEVASFIRANPA